MSKPQGVVTAGQALAAPVFGPKRHPALRWPDLVQVPFQVPFEIRNRLLVDPCRSLIRFHSLIRFPDLLLGNTERLCLTHRLLSLIHICVSGKCEPHQKPSGAQVGCTGKPVADEIAHLWVAAEFFPSAGGDTAHPGRVAVAGDVYKRQ